MFSQISLGAVGGRLVQTDLNDSEDPLILPHFLHAPDPIFLSSVATILDMRNSQMFRGGRNLVTEIWSKMATRMHRNTLVLKGSSRQGLVGRGFTDPHQEPTGCRS